MLGKEGVKVPLDLALDQDELLQLLGQKPDLVLVDGDGGRAGLQRGMLETGVTIQQDLSVPVSLLMSESNERLVRERGQCLRGIESLRGHKSQTTALSEITAAVVGVIPSQAVWFSLIVTFGEVAEAHLGPIRLHVPDLATTDWAALFIASASFVALFRSKVSMLWTPAGADIAGLLVYLIVG